MITLKQQETLQEKLPFWNHLSVEEKRNLIDHSFELSYPKEHAIHNGDLDCLGVLLLQKGSLRVYMLSKEGREITLYRLYPGDICILSASCALKAITFDIFIESVDPCHVIQVESGAFSNIVEHNIYANAFAHQLVTTRFSDVMWAMEQILFMSFDQRLAIFLVDEATKSNSLDIKMTHEQIAKFMGSAREVVSRMLKYFAVEGYVTLSRGNIHIEDLDKLKALT